MSAVCHCEASINGKTVVAEVKEKEEAKAQYDGMFSPFSLLFAFILTVQKMPSVLEMEHIYLRKRMKMTSQ